MSKQTFIEQYRSIQNALKHTKKEILSIKTDIQTLEDLADTLMFCTSKVAIDNLIGDLYEQINILELTELDYKIKIENLLK